MDEVSQVVLLALAVVDLVTDVVVAVLEQIEDGQDLAVVRDQCLTNGLTTSDQLLQHFEGDADDVGVSCVESRLDGDDQLWDNGQHSWASVFQQLEDALNGQESVGVLFLTEPFEEDRQVVVIVELTKIHVVNPLEPASRAGMLNDDGKISSIVVSSELRDLDSSLPLGTSSRLVGRRSLLLLVEGEGFSSNACLLLEL